ncbi:MAG TPA: glycosyltransferase family 2 protein [Thermoanaerobaculia bacterium]|nr:glycosyltransferase family 2 protein [Thermoanaerobaculia bacterium]
MPFLSVITPCYNEELNVRELYEGVRSAFQSLPGYQYEHIFIDNASSDGTVAVLKKIAAEDKNVKIIVNTRNFGHIRSPHHALLQSRGEAVIALAADLQDPPALIPEFIRKWEAGYKLVLGVKPESEENWLMFRLRRAYYDFLGRIANTRLIKNFTGFGMYDREIVEILRHIEDPYPYFRGLIADIGFEPAMIEFRQPRRKRGITHNNFFTLYDMAMLGITNYSKVPLRLATMLGFAMALASFLVSLGYLITKLLFWNRFSFGLAPLLIGIFLIGSIQLFFVGVIGEYVGAIHTQVQHRPLVIEKERINFEEEPRPLAKLPGLQARQ